MKVQLHSFLASVLEGLNGLLHAPHALTKAGTKYVAEREIQLVKKYRITQKLIFPARNRAPDCPDHRTVNITTEHESRRASLSNRA